ncbi:hypothetical protein QJS04_geneDACA021248 [Acorus gramineus]|uniref:Uncharacterized protein n=1 Tax=Acorus gramineus TaxID=55184 RepID=A0AAV9BUW7_ACOGR|nr:hypothetical protein QJS04_geneDACA021248 [Acorus gramineus]
MARHGGWTHTWKLKAAVVAMGICIAAYIVGRPLYWHLAEALGRSASSVAACDPCVCDCSFQPFLALPEELSNVSLTDCAKRDPEVSEEMEKNFIDLLSEELKLREAEAAESQRRGDLMLLEAKKMASQFLKEAEKCNSGMDTCEEAREKAEAALIEQRRLTYMWEMRARQRGWKEGRMKSHV